MSATTKHSSSLTARQRARQATEAQEAKLKARQKKLETAFSAIDDKTAAETTLGAALIELKKLGGTNSSIAEELDLSPRDVSSYIALADAVKPEKEEDDSDDESPVTDEVQADSTVAPAV